MTTKVVARFDKTQMPDVLAAIKGADLIHVGGEVSIRDIALAYFYPHADCVPEILAQQGEAILSTTSARNNLAEAIKRRWNVKLIPVSRQWFTKSRRPEDEDEAARFITWGMGKACAGWLVYEAGNPYHEMLWKVYHSRRGAVINGQVRGEATEHAEMRDAGMDPALCAEAAGELQALMALCEEINEQHKLGFRLVLLPSGDNGDAE